MLKNFICFFVYFLFFYTMFHQFLRTFFANIIGLPGHSNKRKSVLEITIQIFQFKFKKMINKK